MNSYVILCTSVLWGLAIDGINRNGLTVIKEREI